ncbi:[protein-PII] uridylyltransferase [Chitinimonas viridis]|uniref:Bifunctional uridylyltransferase/uridylyl-removing enzyme n=1 Tax=Chitinimonas viridis TaxID=664880 RepID=A0ABT8BA21_9NEIS|nr:[protein-PII] uridylyltransferase [Chitinimonas viridis]MDN3578988.1 [protein-PII] uridylyltransferase [Chitinimonas viridis]
MTNPEMVPYPHQSGEDGGKLPDIAAMNAPLSIPDLKRKLHGARTALYADYCDPELAGSLLEADARLVDQFLIERWREQQMDPQAALIAVGGYGRGQLFPGSDIDLLFLLPEGASQPLLDKVESLIGLLWDLGLEVGHSVRTLRECMEEARRDITVQTTLLETRLLSGSGAAYSELMEQVFKQLDPRAFFEAKLLEQQQRHERHQGSVNKLEPNVKEAPGGLRDLHLLLWLARACGIASDWSGLHKAGMLTGQEMRKLKRAEKMLWSFRIALHLAAGRREDRILFDFQNALAKRFGYADTSAARASEQLMAVYYLSARIVAQLQPLILQALRRTLYGRAQLEIQPINERFVARGHLLEIANPEVYEQTPSAILETFLVLQQHPELTAIGADTLRALWHARPRINAAFRRDPANKALFMEIMRQPWGTTRVMRRMNQYGVLGRYIPAFGKIVGRMQHDLFHVYTVDEHILMVLRNLRRFATPAFNHEYPACSQLIEAFERPEVLYLAALFHDIGKGRGGDHSQLGKVDAREFCVSHGLSKEDTDMVAWLVEHHLTMSSVAQKQDVYDPDTVAAFAQIVRDERHLNALYLLTVADIRGTSPKVWNAWKAKLLEDLFRATRRYLTGETLNANDALYERRSEAESLMRRHGLRDDAHLPFWKTLDPVYFLRHDAPEIAWHGRVLWGRFDHDEITIRARPAESDGGLQVLVYCPDRPDLFARICAFFERAGYSIFDAKIYTTLKGYALDSFYVHVADGRDIDYRDLVGYIEYELAQLIIRDEPLPPPLSGRVSRVLKHFPLPPQVLIRQDDKQKLHILSLIAGDRPGLLSRIARVLSAHAIAIHSAKIMTLGERAEDTFTISGNALADPKSLVRLEADLMETLRV